MPPAPVAVDGKKLTLTIGTVELHIQAMKAILDNEEAEASTVTFEEANQGGGRNYFIDLTAIQSLDAQSWWRFSWDNPGVEATFTLRPAGNAAASATQPHFTGKITMPPRPKLGGEAGVDVRQTFDQKLMCVGVPVMKTA